MTDHPLDEARVVIDAERLVIEAERETIVLWDQCPRRAS